MKQFTLAPEVIAAIQEKISELHDICLTNGVPYVFSAVVSNDGERTEKAISAMLSGEKGLAPDFLVAMCEIAKAPDIAAGIFSAMGMLSNMDDNGDIVCKCPKCTARREGMAEVKPDNAPLH